MTTRLFMYVGIGGMIGAIARYRISLMFNELSGFPYATLATNLIGCFLLSLLLNANQIKQRLSAEMRIALGTGLIGSFTTFSTFALETIELSNHHPFLAFTYILLSIFGGLACCYLGYRLANHRQRLDAK